MPIYESSGKTRPDRAMKDLARESFAENLADVCCAAITEGYELRKLNGRNYELRADNGDGTYRGVRFILRENRHMARAWPIGTNSHPYPTLRKMRLSLNLTRGTFKD